MGASWGGFESLAIPFDVDALPHRDEMGAGRPGGAPPYRAGGRERSDRRSRARLRGAGRGEIAADGQPSDIVMMDALALSRAIQAKQVSCVEVMNAYLDHIDALNPKVNAIVSLQDRGDLIAAGQGARRRARARRIPRLDARLSAGDQGPDRDQGHPHHARLAASSRISCRPPTPSWSSA